MKKHLTITIIMCMLLTTTVFAESNNIDEQIKGLWLDPIENSTVIDNIRANNEKKIQENIDLYLIAPGTYRQKIGISADDEVMKEQVRRSYEVFPENILKIYYLEKNANANQYAKEECLEYMISDDYYLYMAGYDYNINDYDGTETVKYRPHNYCADGTTEGYEQFYKEHCYSGGIGEEGYNFVKNSEELKNILSQNSISQIEEMKVVIIGNDSTCLYIKCADNEYLIRLYTGQYYNPENDNPYHKDEDWVPELELFKLYNAKDFFKTVSDEMDEMNEIKPTYETEAKALQAEGLLLGNEKGLDLLKPLTRIEAATMLLRAMGESTDYTTQTQTFSDVPVSHWGYGAAENAYSLGLVMGIGDGLFAPDDSVTAEQFATMVLRAANHSPFNWEEAVNIMISEGVITSENAETMDLFTRGDMAKIIYEARERNLF